MGWDGAIPTPTLGFKKNLIPIPLPSLTKIDGFLDFLPLKFPQ